MIYHLGVYPGSSMYGFVLASGLLRLATHSMVFIHKSDLNEISIILNQGNDHISVTPLEQLIPQSEKNSKEGVNIMRNHIYQALGYEPR